MSAASSIARIPGSGAIAARGTITGFDIGFADRTDDTAIYDFLPDGTGVFRFTIVATGLPPGFSIKLTTQHQGATFANGSRYTTITAADLDANGIATIEVLYPPGSDPRVCHTAVVLDEEGAATSGTGTINFNLQPKNLIEIKAPFGMRVNDNHDSWLEVWDKDTEPVVRDNDLQLIILKAVNCRKEPAQAVFHLKNLGRLTPKFWVDDEKKVEFQIQWSKVVPAGDEWIQEFYVEGDRSSVDFEDVVWTGTIEYGDPERKVIPVFQLDLDVDSDNNGTIDGDDEDRVERSTFPDKPGKVLFGDRLKDSDADGVPDFADGLGLAPPYGGGNSGACGGPDSSLVPMEVEISKLIDPTIATIEFGYGKIASIPREESDNGGHILVVDAESEDLPRRYNLLKTGLRIWAVDAPGRNGSADVGQDVTQRGGKFVPPDKPILWADLARAANMPITERKLTLYLEHATAHPVAVFAQTEQKGKEIINVRSYMSTYVVNVEDTVFVNLLPTELAPDVLAVNSDFDEGRINPVNGYPIPDCDDVKDVDARSGAGNTELSLKAARQHLDKPIYPDDRVTEDLHAGWFGVNPMTTLVEPEFWDGATVTIKKIDKLDPETGMKERGQIRFYAEWGSTHCGIVPYDLETLTPNNLVTGGIPSMPGKGVYGSAAGVPRGAQFWIEGVRPGKITLEWRLQKGQIDFKCLQTFLVETRKSPLEWKQDLAYKIRLDTSTDPTGQIDVSINPATVPYAFFPTVERMSEYYDYYKENYLVDDDFQWSGLAKLAGTQVVAGMSDAYYAPAIAAAIASGEMDPSLYPHPGPSPARVAVQAVVDEMNEVLGDGGYAIFSSLAWQHHAYRSSGIGALRWSSMNFDDRDLNRLLVHWAQFELGKEHSNQELIRATAKEFARYEQNFVIVQTWERMAEIDLGIMDLTNVYTKLAVNVMHPLGDDFTEAVPGGNLGNASQRWLWIDDSPSASPNGIIGAWNQAGKAGQRPLVSSFISQDGKRFAWLSSPFPFLCNDHEDVP